MDFQRELVRVGMRAQDPGMWAEIKRKLGFGVGQNLISPRFWPEAWAGIWAAMIAVNSDPERSDQELMVIDIAIILPIERALAAGGHSDILGRVARQLSITAEVERMESVRGSRDYGRKSPSISPKGR